MLDAEDTEQQQSAQFFYIDNDLYNDMCTEIVQLRVTNESLESNMSALRGSKLMASHELHKKDAVIKQLKKDVADMQSKSGEALMQWKGKCFV